MADEENKNKKEEEYQFSEEEYPAQRYDVDEQLAQERKSFAQRIFTKRVLIVIGLIIAILGVYEIISIRQRAAQFAAQQPTPPVAPVAQQQVPVQPPPAVTSDVDVLRQQVNQLSQQNQSNQQTIGTMQSQLQQIQASQSEINSAMSDVSDQLKQLASDVKRITVITGAPSHRMTIIVARPQYQLKAIVPGRAWILMPSGKLITVTVGDPIEGNGTVQLISPLQGIVATSTGTIIQYGPRDS